MRYLKLCAIFLIANCSVLTANVSTDDVLNFWLTELQSPDDYPFERSKIWFNAGPIVDQEILERFEPKLVSLKNGIADEEKQTPRDRLALIIVADQFSRNMYRGTPEAFAFDNIALSLALEGIANGDDLKLFPVERIFFYLPLEHAEDMSIQELSMSKFRQLQEDAPESLNEVFKSYTEYAQMHYDTINQFGRFPTRNKILHRESTEEEIIFLDNN